MEFVTRTLPEYQSVHQSGSYPEPRCLEVLTGFYYIGLIKSWLTSISSLPPGRSDGWKFQPSNYVLGLSSDQPPLRSYLQALTGAASLAQQRRSHLGNSKGFWSSVTGIRTNEDQIDYITLYILNMSNLLYTISVFQLYLNKAIFIKVIALGHK